MADKRQYNGASSVHFLLPEALASSTVSEAIGADVNAVDTSETTSDPPTFQVPWTLSTSRELIENYLRSLEHFTHFLDTSPRQLMRGAHPVFIRPNNTANTILDFQGRDTRIQLPLSARC